MVASPPGALAEDGSPATRFTEILTHIGEEDYDRCASAATDFIRDYGERPDAKRYLPYAKFFRLFASAYHTWQGSYHYTPIRATFRLAVRRLQEEVLKLNLTRRHDRALVTALRVLCNVLVRYVWCENSTINNDPFALVRHSRKAVRWEERGIDFLKGCSIEEEHLKAIREWLLEYFERNYHLHSGLNACALIYSSILRDRACPEFDALIEKATQARDLLKSPELSSELNAHIRYVSQHYARLTKENEPPTYLRVRSGKLVLSLSAACDRAGARRILDGEGQSYQIFKQETKTGLANLGLEVHSFRPSKLMDIFETSFGESFLMSLTFDVGSARLWFLEKPPSYPYSLGSPANENAGERPYDFDVRVTLSALGTCTVSFEMPIDLTEFPDGLSVEEIRALQCCICPHAGQIRLQVKRAGGQKASPARFFDRADIRRLIDATKKLRYETSRVNEATLAKTDRVQKATLLKRIDELNDQLEGYANRRLTTSPSKRHKEDEELCKSVNSVLELAEKHAPYLTSATKYIRSILGCCYRHRRLSDFGVEILEAVAQAFRTAGYSSDAGGDSEEADMWLLRPDLGWYAYLYAKRIDEVEILRLPVRQESDAWLTQPGEGRYEHIHAERVYEIVDLRPLKLAAGFNEIQRHPDMRGLIIDQREARTSFDDWRFMTEKESNRNLALIRSHATDAFYTSEFQTFFYFPDVHQYIADQYEETVKLNLRLNIGLRFYNWRAELLTDLLMKLVRRDPDVFGEDKSQSRFPRLRKFRNSLLKLPGIRDFRLVRQMKRQGDRIELLRSEANELHNLLFKAGISRYQDHGELMKGILDQTNAQAAADMTGRHLQQLDDLNKELMERQRTSRTMWFTIAASLVAASVTKDFFEGLVKAACHSGQWFCEESTADWVVLVCMLSVLVGSSIIGWILLKAPSAE